MGAGNQLGRQFVQHPLPIFAGQAPTISSSGDTIAVQPGSDWRRNDRGNVEVRRDMLFGHNWEPAGARAALEGRVKRQVERDYELGSGQLSMFMTPSEIHDRYQPLDADRDSVEEVHYSPLTKTSPNTRQSTWVQEHDDYYRVDNDLVTDRAENDDELWDRKLDESVESGLYDSIAAHGVQYPIRLGQERGSMGRPQIVGGHHRLAAATELNSDQFVPVLHDQNISEARSPATQKAWRYR